jgi:hypothetical protein
MKKIIILLALVVAATRAEGQPDSLPAAVQSIHTYHVYRDAGLALAPTVLFNTPNGISPAVAFKIRMFLGKYVSFDSEFILGNDYIAFGPGLIGIPSWLLLFPNLNEEIYSLEDLIGVGLLILMSTEHIAFHIPLNNLTDISPYVSLLRFKKYYKHGYADFPGISEDQASFAIGLEVNKYFDKFVLSPYAEYNVGYSDHRSGLNVGLYFGVYIFRKIR